MGKIGNSPFWKTLYAVRDLDKAITLLESYT